MPEKNTISNWISMVISGGAVLIISISAFSINFIINFFKKSIEDLHEDFEEEKKHNREMHNQHYDDIHDLKTLVSTRSIICDNNHKGKKDE